jgi:phosphoribosylamine--glycine ligase
MAGGRERRRRRELERGSERLLPPRFRREEFGTASSRILVEEFLTGEEVSFMVITDGKKSLRSRLPRTTRKRSTARPDRTPAGMGAHSPAVVLNGETAGEIMKTIMLPTLQGMAAEGRPYTVFFTRGLMLTPKGPKVLEYNCRFGDPETQVQMMRLEDDLADIFLKASRGSLGDTKLNWRKEASRVRRRCGRWISR